MELARQETFQKVVVEDDGLVGRPFRQGWWGDSGPVFRAVKESDGTVRFLCSSSAIFFRRRRIAETFRKLGTVLGACQGFVSLHHLQVLRRQRAIRQSAKPLLGRGLKEGQARCLLRLDDFPSPYARSEDFLTLHQIAVEYRLPYLLAVTPFPEQPGRPRQLTDEELGILRRCAQQGAEYALHGFSHRSRYRNYASELLALPIDRLQRALDMATACFSAKGLKMTGFVAPFNSYDPYTLEVLAQRFPLLCGGPESVFAWGYRAGPSFFMQSVYVPSYRYVYDLDQHGLRRLDRMIAQADGLIIPITLHWANEAATGCKTFRALCSRLANRTIAWGQFLSLTEWTRSIACIEHTTD
jgi:peptidoglycan/xylan/chitin deacetylase (PgdA/CDA1 family)